MPRTVAEPGRYFAQDHIDYPAAPDVRPFRPTMGQDDLVITSGVHERVRQEREPIEGVVVVGPSGQAERVIRAPPGVEGDGAERIGDHFADKLSLSPARNAAAGVSI